MAQTVPLVVYVKGERIVIGTAEVEDDGTVVATIDSPDENEEHELSVRGMLGEYWKDTFRPETGSFSIYKKEQ